MFYTDTDLRRPELRWHQTEDQLTECSCLGTRLGADKLYFHGPGKLAIHYQAKTSRGAGCRAKLWLQKLRKVLDWLPGDLEGILVFEVASAADIPKEFHLSARGGVRSTSFKPKTP